MFVESLKKNLGARIEELRTARRPRLSRERLAELIGVAPVTIFRWESGKSFPEYSSIVRLAEILGVTTHELLGTSAPLATPAIQELAQTIADQANEIRLLKLKGSTDPEVLKKERHLQTLVDALLTIKRLVKSGAAKTKIIDFIDKVAVLIEEGKVIKLVTDIEITEFLPRLKNIEKVFVLSYLRGVFDEPTVDPSDKFSDTEIVQKYKRASDYDKLFVRQMIRGFLLEKPVDTAEVTEVLSRFKKKSNEVAD